MRQISSKQWIQQTSCMNLLCTRLCYRTYRNMELRCCSGKLPIIMLPAVWGPDTQLLLLSQVSAQLQLHLPRHSVVLSPSSRVTPKCLAQTTATEALSVRITAQRPSWLSCLTKTSVRKAHCVQEAPFSTHISS